MIPNLPTTYKERIIRLPEVMHRTGWSRSSVYLRVSRKEMPSPIKLGSNSRAIGWLESEIENWIQVQVTDSKNKSSGV